jgi:hypothetical protein
MKPTEKEIEFFNVFVKDFMPIWHKWLFENEPHYHFWYIGLPKEKQIYETN